MSDPIAAASLLNESGTASGNIYQALPVGTPIVFTPRVTDSGGQSFGALPVGVDAKQLEYVRGSEIQDIGGRLYRVASWDPSTWLPSYAGTPTGERISEGYWDAGGVYRSRSASSPTTPDVSGRDGALESVSGAFLLATAIGLGVAWIWSRG